MQAQFQIYILIFFWFQENDISAVYLHTVHEIFTYKVPENFDVVEVCKGPGLAWGLYPARPAGQQVRGIFSNGPGRGGKWGVNFTMGRGSTW